MEVNFFSTIRLQQALTPAVNACAGRVVFMSSVGGIVPNDGNGPYCASKTALEAYATILRVECYPWGTKVCVLRPCALRTPMSNAYAASMRTTWNAMAAQDSANANAWWRRVYTEEWLDGCVKYTQALLDAVAGDPQLAVDSMMHAVCAAAPRISYMPGTDAGKRFFWQLWTMPESWACGRQYTVAAATAPKVVTAATE
eukprot:TRINITY_DN261_c0_g1_i3.p1 TRINITY_DN261_c0_g1~~TRINITY_DN261_c0_g1_i3.p1  ORF type:complete len:199 (-),score=45.39 TRINITY_DN261_c0_g1_i3:694-1290(-)